MTLNSKITDMLRRAGAFVHSPSHPAAQGPVPQLHDYPVARRRPRPGNWP